ncbi:MAG TPA: hypothetical protein DCR44_03730 [Acholeplasmatales bacterium]|nr:MAG: hypothetical protein A2Y16_01375 [Tenericutes bacterium GWF2_57_13]HAQ56493.1 hypothetical protein [Acholeplasmatales bacterium]
MKKHIVKTLIVTGVIALIGFGATLTAVNAEPVDFAVTPEVITELGIDGYTLEEMLTAALQDEWLALAEYQAIIDTYGVIRPFTNIIAAEATHVALLLPLFEAYGIEVPENTAAAQVVVPDSITSALATGVAAEQANIAMYEVFLAQADLPEDVASVFSYLKTASVNHLNAFSRDRYTFVGQDMMNGFKKIFRNGYNQGGNTGNGQGGNGQGSQNVGSRSQGNGGVCPIV